MSILKEFKDFVSRGNVIELAIGIVIGASFGKIVSSLVSDVIMPPIGLLISGIDFRSIKIVLKDAVVDPAGKLVTEAVAIQIGNFIQSVIDFLIIAFVIFLVVKLMNRLKKKEEDKKAEPAPVPREEVLLTEIRDLLKNK